MIRNLVKQTSIYLVILLVLVSCMPEDEQTEFSYAVFNEGATSPSRYLVRKISMENDYRNEQILHYDQALQLNDTDTEKYIVAKQGLQRVDAETRKPYLTILDNECVEFEYENEQINDILATKICYLGVEDITIGEIQYKKAHKFKKTMGYLDGVTSHIYYDSDFIPIKEEYIEGYAGSYSMVRLDTALVL